MLNLFITRFIVSGSKDKDRARREFILNIILFALLLLSIAALAMNLLQPLIYPTSKGGEVTIVVAVFFGFVAFLYFLSRVGQGKLSTYILLFSLFVIAAYRTYYWGADTAIMLLLFALIITMAGVLLDSKRAFLFTAISSAVLITVTYMEASSIYSPHSYWKQGPIKLSDTIVNAIILLIISTITWLFNRDLQKALKRARRSEKALKKERDKLEITVEQRTAQLKAVQTEKISQLYRFAEFGKLSSGLFHDLVNPLTIVSLNLRSINSNKKDVKELSEIKIALERAIVGTRRLEEFIEAARKQIQNRDVNLKFSLVKETAQSLHMLEHKAKEQKVKISFVREKDVILKGNPFKYSQLILNLVSNAIDSYAGTRTKRRDVVIQILKKDNSVELVVCDRGCGISPENLDKVFEPLFTTKSFARGTGIGLSIAKDIVENGMHGSIKVESSKSEGTIFTVILPKQKN